jgi:hypothetical protein
MTKYPPYLIKGLLVLSLLAFGVSHTSTWLFSDPAKFIVHSNKIRKGYVAENLEAHRARQVGEPAIFNQLLTEGGYLFTLALVHALHPDLTYSFNGLLLPIFLWMVFWLLRLTQPGRGPPLAFLLFLLLLFGVPNLRHHIGLYCLPYRDMSAHTLALLSLNLGLVALRSKRPFRWLALSGVSLGLGIWFRLPVFLFIPAAAILLCLNMRNFPPLGRVKAMVVMGAGGLIGLLPLFGQNLLEGKLFYQSGQMNMMLSSGSLSMADAGTTTISLANASYNARPQIELMFKILPGWLWILIAIGIVHGFVRKPTAGNPLDGPTSYRLRTSLLLSIAAAFILFYSCYIKPVPRYIWMADFILLPFAVSWARDAFQLLSQRKTIALSMVTAGLALAAAGLCLYWALDDGALNRARRASRDTRTFAQWIDRELPDASALVCGSHALRGWAENYGPRDLHVLSGWLIDTPPNMPMVRKGKTLRPFLLNLFDEEDQRMPSVWRNDIQNHFDLQPDSEKCWINYMPFTALSLEEIVPRARTRQMVVLKKADQPTIHLAVHAARTEPREIRITSSTGESLWAGALNSGPNIFSFPQPVASDVYLESTLPLPPLKDIRSGATPGIRYDFKYYGEIPSVSNYVSKVSMLIYGYSEWARDWGHVESSRSAPVFRVNDGSSWRVPMQPKHLNVRMYFTARLHESFSNIDAAEPMNDLHRFYYTYAGERVKCTTYYVGPTYRYNRYKALDLIQVISIPASRQDETPILLHRDEVDIQYDVILLRTEYEALKQASAPEQVPSSAVHLKRTQSTWSKGIPASLPSWHRLNALEESP